MAESEYIKRYLMLLLFLTCISPYFHTDILKQTTVPLQSYSNEQVVTSDILSYTTHNPIVVIGDDNFTPNGFSGDGTWQSPYVIKNLNISSVDGPTLQFINVTRPFVIRSCLLTSPVEDNSSVISFKNASNWLVDNSTISGSRNGVYISECDNIRVMDNTISGQTHDALRVHFSRNVTLANNIVKQSDQGLFMTYTNDVIVTDNSFSQLQLGIYTERVINGSIESNVFEMSSGGVIYWGSNMTTRINRFVDISGVALGCTNGAMGYSSPNPRNFPLELQSYFEFNTFENCSVAFLTGWGGSSLFANNTILDCGVGVQLDYSAGNQIIGNSIQNSRTYNLLLEHTDLNLIHSNTITGAGIKNALDEDGLNYWDDRTSQGNIWDDYIGPEVYHISGSSEAIDHWPQRYGAPYISAINETEITVGTIGVNVTWNAFDSDPSIYTIYLNGTEILSEIWNGGNISISLDNYEVGTYNVTITVTDEEGLSSSHTVFVRVIPTYDPLFFPLFVVGSVGLVLCVVFFKKRSVI
ncbi:MAG: right-handed parallel beta-helix repeat-containing protein [Candidatus Thorarchaeota archaeon]